MTYGFEHTREQLQAIDSDSKYILCLAGAGSGKTKVLVDRICRLVRSGVNPNNLLALTFTRKAAGEMKKRIAIELGSQIANTLWINTFHAVGLKMLHEFGHEIGYDNRIIVFSEQDRLDVFNEITRRMGLSDILSKKAGMDAYQWFGATGELPDPQNDLYPIFNLYLAKLREWGCLCFAMILFETRRLLSESTKAYEHYHDKFKYIFVDEFQDTDIIQYNLHNLLKPENLFCVGDDYQAIYSFRYADIGIILGFEDDHPEAETIKLQQNFRSTNQIVMAGKNLISYNQNQIHKDLFSRRHGEMWEHSELIDVVDESEFIALTIDLLIKKDGYEPKDIAILYRMHSQAPPISDFMERYEIPHNVVKPTKSFWESEEIRGVLSVLSVALNPNDDHHFKMSLNFPVERVDRKKTSKAERFARENELSLFDVFSKLCPGFWKPGRGYEWETLETWHLVEYIDKLIEYIPSRTALEVITKCIELLEIKKWYLDHMLTTRLENLDELLTIAKDWMIENLDRGEPIGIGNFLDWVNLQGIEQQSQINEEKNEVTMCTIHAAKGLEWTCVVVVGVAEGIFPHKRATTAEERRLFYVAITRAKDRLIVTNPKSRQTFGKITEHKPSRFLGEMLKGKK